jgi:hypothetical protein
MVLVYPEEGGPELESSLLHQRVDDDDEPRPSLLEALISLEAVEARPARDLAVAMRELLEAEGVRAVFLVGHSRPLEPAVQAAAEYGLQSRVPLYSVEAGDHVLAGWSPVVAEASSEERKPTLGSHPVEGEDLEIARAADEEAALAVRLEDLLDELIRP